MKNVWLHGVYLSIIGILVFQLYATTKARDLAFEQVEEILKNNFQVLDADTQSLFEKIQKQYPTNPVRYEGFMTQATLVRNESKSVLNFISKELVNTQPNVIGIKDSVQRLFNKLSSTADKTDSIELANKFGLNKLLQNDTFWKIFNENQTTSLLLLKNQIKFDNLVYYNYLLDKIGEKFELICGPTFMLAIAPKKAALIEGEKFEADVYLGQYSNNPSSDFILNVNNQNLIIKEGVGHFEKIEKTTGLKTIHALAKIFNPIIGDTIIVKGEYEYHVLPKCSQNCQ